jgi:hypothetical protein
MKINSTMDNPFARTLQEHGLDLVRDRCHTLKVNVGLIPSITSTFSPTCRWGVFGSGLKSTGNLNGYMATLARAFNPCTVEGLRCRSLVSVAWNGTLYDCDFNQGAGLPMGGHRMYIRDLDGPPPAGAAIVTGEHCYACTAVSGLT